MTDTVLVTGAAGFIGSHLSERLLDLGYRVVGLDNFDDCYAAAIKRDNVSCLLARRGFCLVEGDVRDGEMLDRLFRENSVGAVAHLAARAGVRPSIENPMLYESINTSGTLSVLNASRRAKVEQFLLTSSSSVYGLRSKAPFSEESTIDYPISPYAASKAAAELFGRVYSHLYGMRVVVLRPFTVYGPRQRPEMAISRFVELIDRREEVTLFGDGSSVRDYTYVDDIVSGYQRALTYKDSAFEVFNLGAGRIVGLRELVSLIENAVGEKAKVTMLESQPGDVPLTHADISKARSMLGYEPRVSIEEGIPRFVEWYLRKRGAYESSRGD